MTEFAKVVRVDSLLEIGPYTFLDQDDAVINLTSDFVAVSVRCDLKRKGALDIVEPATFVSQAGGTAHVALYTFTDPGIWMAQFVCTNAGGQELEGDPIIFNVVENVDDLIAGRLDEVLEN